MNSLMLMPLVMPLMLPGGFDGVEPYAEPIVRRAVELRGLGAAARRCGVSHTHLRKVLQGERKPSAILERKMRRLGLKAGELKEGK